MDQLGFGVMIGILGGNKDSVEAFNASVGKTIESVFLDDALHFVFTDGSRMKISDEGQSCCESRYMQTDDDLSFCKGAKFLGAEIKEAPDVEDKYGVHEVAFLEIQTDKGAFTVSTHNEHNGYYGGFLIRAAKENS